MQLYALGSGLVRVTPTSAANGFVGSLARTYYDLGSKRARWARANLELAFPDLSASERDEIGRASYANFMTHALDFIRSESWSDDELRARVEVSGEEHAERALAKGRGLLLLTLHMGNFEVGVQAFSLALRDHHPCIVGRPMRNEALYARITAGRSRGTTEVIDRRQAGIRMLRALRASRPVGVLLDQYSRRSRGVFVPLFGVRCSTSAGMATLAVRTGCPVVPCYALSEGPDRHRAIFLPELDIHYTGDREKDIPATTARYNEVLEAIIREHPEQWMWGHRRFRHSPDLDRDLYT